MASTPKRDALSIDELLVFWRSVVDSGYSQPLLERLPTGISIDAGEDDPPSFEEPNRGIEAFTQQMAQLKRVSEAVVRNGEAMFILPHSGQVAPPASGQSCATVSLDFTRTRRIDQAVTFKAGTTIVEERQVDSGLPTGLEVFTGRRYLLVSDLTFLPGEPGPKPVAAKAEKAGFGYNNPLAGTISRLVQPGAGLTNTLAAAIPGTPTHRLQVGPNPDVVVPEHVGQYVEFLSGLNAGKVMRVVGYQGPDPGIPHGGVATLARTAVLRVSGVAGTFVDNEEVEQATTGAKGNFVALGNAIYLVLERADSTFAPTFVVTGSQSGAAATVDAVEQDPALAAETTAAWRVLDFADDLGFAVTNLLSPDGGAADLLDELGRGRGLPRTPGEPDGQYRKRVSTLPDVVSPNAIRRLVNRILAQVGATVCLRESGGPLAPGFYADVDAADYDFDLQPQLEWHVAFNYEEFRGFFFVGVPPLNIGEFGVAYDEGQANAYDADPFLAFYDGFPLTAAILYLSIFNAVDKARAGGVGFELYVEDQGCF